MPFKFENLDVWKRSVEYIDLVYDLADRLPRSEDFNLKSQIIRAATSVALNIAEGSTGQTDAEQSRFLGMAIRSLMETVACLHLIRRRGLVADDKVYQHIYTRAETLAAKLHTFRKSISPDKHWVKDAQAPCMPDPT